MHFFFFQFIALSLTAVVSDDGLYDLKAFYKLKHCFYLLFINDAEFINY